VLDRQLIWLTCSVRDTGIGIDSDRLEMMFVAFQQADSSISPLWRYRAGAVDRPHLGRAHGRQAAR
jgi:signal transduction histidine kinase